MIDVLKEEASRLINRSVEVVQVPNGWVVEWFSFNTPPAPVKPTEEEALKAFIQFINEHCPSKLEELSDGINDTGN